MLERSTVQHLRFAFFWHLFPVFLFAVSESTAPHWPVVAGLFLILHGLVYPASNGFNSFYDKDEKSIGEVEHPLPVTPELLRVSLFLDFLALVAAAFLGWGTFVGVLLYGLISKAYSHPAVRLKALPLIGWMTIAFFQGGMIYLLTQYAAQRQWVPDWKGALISSLLVGAGYPLTQVYQREEDARRGDRTLSVLLGVRGTFVFSGICFALTLLALVGFYWGEWRAVVWLLTALLPTAIYFLYWMQAVWKNAGYADFRHTRTMSRLGATCFNLAFVGLLLGNGGELRVHEHASGILHTDEKEILYHNSKIREPNGIRPL